MTKLSRKFIDPKKFGHYVNSLWSAFTLMDSKEDIRLLFKDLFTHTEYKMFAKRLEIARRLIRGEKYENIQGDLNVTPNTINRMSNILIERGVGLREVHKKLDKLEEKYLERQRERTKNLENAFRKKTQRKNLLGESLKVGVKMLGRAISKKIKEKSATKSLTV